MAGWWCRLAAIAFLLGACASGGDDPADEGAADGTTTLPADTGVDLLAEDTEDADDALDPDVFRTEQLDENEATLTGRPVEDPALLDRPALAVKIDNVDQARPQAGINEADLVYEELVEGGLTRLLAVFHSTDPEVVGPVRSARSTDVPLLMPLTMPLFSWSGSNADFAELLDITAVIDVGVDRRPEAYVRRSGREAPSNLYTRPEVLRSYTPDSALSPRPMFEFLAPAQTAAPGSSPTPGVDVAWGATEVAFRWDEALGGWRRSQNGSDHVDERGGVVAPKNLVVQFVPYVNTDAVDSNGAPVPEAQIASGEGIAWVMSGGRVVEGTWFKANVTVESVYLDAAGERIPMARGSTWVLLVPEGRATLVEQ